MRCRRFDDPGLFLDQAKPFLAEREAENTVLVGAALRCQQRAHGDAVMVAVHDRSRVCLAAVMMPPFNLVLSAGADPAALPVLGTALLDAGIAPPGVVGSRPLADAFAGWWCRQRQTGVEPEHDLVLYQAGRITPPAGIAGELRRASEDDLGLLVGWHERFVHDAGLSADEAVGARGLMATRIERHEVFLWVTGGRPVSMAAFVPTTLAGDAGRINSVFTPKAERSRGYATACVAALSGYLLAGSWRYVLIFADAHNPITNHVYPRIGYEALGPFRSLVFRS